MENVKVICSICEGIIQNGMVGDPYIKIKEKPICSDCCLDVIQLSYTELSGFCGGVMPLIFKYCLTRISKPKKKRTNYIPKFILKELLHKYKFECAFCGSKKKLSVDHIKPVSKGGTDDFKNLQILCFPCNRKKSNHYEETISNGKTL